MLEGLKVKSVAEKNYDVPYGRGEANKRVGLLFFHNCVCVCVCVKAVVRTEHSFVGENEEKWCSGRIQYKGLWKWGLKSKLRNTTKWL